MAVIAEGKNGRVYLPPTPEQEMMAEQALPQWRPEQDMPRNPRWFSPPIYGMATFGDIFTSRQLVVLTTFSNLIPEARARALINSEEGSFDVLTMGEKYVDAVVTYLALAIDRLADRNSTICSWDVSRDSTRNTFARQAIPMIWDFAEANPFSDSTGNFLGAVEWVAEAIENAPYDVAGLAIQRDAVTAVNAIATDGQLGTPLLISTDPPYYDNIGYADLSDFFYVWLRRSLRSIYPDLFETVLVPKAQELIATPYRFNGDRHEAQKFFETGLERAFEQMRRVHHPDYPLTVYTNLPSRVKYARLRR